MKRGRKPNPNASERRIYYFICSTCKRRRQSFSRLRQTKEICRHCGSKLPKVPEGQLFFGEDFAEPGKDETVLSIVEKGDGKPIKIKTLHVLKKGFVNGPIASAVASFNRGRRVGKKPPKPTRKSKKSIVDTEE